MSDYPVDEDDGDDGEIWFMAEARAAVQGILESLEFNPVSNEVGVVLPVRLKRDPVEWFSTFEDISLAISEFADSTAATHAPFDGGAPVVDIDTIDLVDEELMERGVHEFFDSLPDSEDGSMLFDPSEYAPRSAGPVFSLDVGDINAELIAYLARHPEKMHSLTPRKFEELVAEIFRVKGYDVVLTPASKDGGYDLMIAHKTELGNMLSFVECKRYSSDNPVGVEIVRSLFGVVTSHGATTGVVCTTSRFTKGASEFQQTNKHRIKLHDGNDLLKFLKSYRIAKAH